MSEELARMDRMRVEWLAWQAVVAEWRSLNLPDMNAPECEPLIRAIELWGEELVRLRATQTPDIVAEALKDRKRAYRSREKYMS